MKNKVFLLFAIITVFFIVFGSIACDDDTFQPNDYIVDENIVPDDTEIQNYPILDEELKTSSAFENAVNYVLNYFDSSKKEGCSTWVSMGMATNYLNFWNRKTILHKNRDVTAVFTENSFLEISNGLFRYIAIGDYDNNQSTVQVWAGINEKGLAAASNYVQGSLWVGKYSGAESCREILENCASVEEAYDWIERNKNNYSNGNIIFIVEDKKAAIVEVKQSYNFFGIPSGMKISSLKDSIIDNVRTTPSGKDNVDFRTNHYIVFDNLVDPGNSSTNRYERLMDQLTRPYWNGGLWGKINVTNSNKFSAEVEGDVDGDYNGLCQQFVTVQRITIDIDGNDPLDSDLWAAGGYPCNDDYDKYGFEIPTVLYDLYGATSWSSRYNIYECDVDKFPFDGSKSNRNKRDEPSTTKYRRLWTPNSKVWSTDNPGSNDESLIWVEMEIDERPNDIERLEFVFQGYGDEEQDFEIWVKEANEDWEDNSSWQKVCEEEISPDDEERVIRCKLDDDISSYIENDLVTWVIYSPEEDSAIHTNYIKMDVVLED